jgi:hypothetical protein
MWADISIIIALPSPPLLYHHYGGRRRKAMKVGRRRRRDGQKEGRTPTVLAVCENRTE